MSFKHDITMLNASSPSIYTKTCLYFSETVSQNTHRRWNKLTCRKHLVDVVHSTRFLHFARYLTRKFRQCPYTSKYKIRTNQSMLKNRLNFAPQIYTPEDNALMSMKFLISHNHNVHCMHMKSMIDRLICQNECLHSSNFNDEFSIRFLKDVAKMMTRTAGDVGFRWPATVTVKMEECVRRFPE